VLATFERAGERHGVLQRCRLLQFDVGAEGLLQTRRKDGDLLRLRDVLAARQEHEELLLIIVDGKRAAELGEFAQGVAAEQRPEAPVDAIYELRPRWNALILLQAVVPLAGGAVEIEGRCRNLEMFRRTVGAEELLPFVQPCDGIVAAVVLGESQLVVGRRRWAGRRGVVGVETALLVQELGLDVLHGGGDEAGFLANGRDFPVHALAKVADHLHKLVEHSVHGGLGGRRVVTVLGHCGGAMGLRRAGEGWDVGRR